MQCVGFFALCNLAEVDQAVAQVVYVVMEIYGILIRSFSKCWEI